MPIVRVEMWAGRPQKIKGKIAQEITDTMVRNLGCPEEAVTILFTDVAKEDWVIGSKSCAELSPNR